ncbi:MAG: Lrp/AsnC family transcriptional regulator [Candidatus Hodarchaeota archaeon]
MKLDDKDLQILSLLQEDGRAKYTQIARTLSKAMNQNIPDTTILFRIRKLQQAGVIKRFTVSIDQEMLGYTIYGVLFIEIGGHILRDITIEHTRKIRAELESRSKVIFLALNEDETGIFAIILGKEKTEIQGIFDQLKDNPDVVDARLWFLRPPTRGDSLIGTGLPIHQTEENDGV